MAGLKHVWPNRLALSALPLEKQWMNEARFTMQHRSPRQMVVAQCRKHVLFDLRASQSPLLFSTRQWIISDFMAAYCHIQLAGRWASTV